MEHSGLLIKKTLKSVGMTQAILAAKIGKDQSLISRYLNGYIEISNQTARNITKVLHIDFAIFCRKLELDRYIRQQAKLEAEFEDIRDLIKGIKK